MELLRLKRMLSKYSYYQDEFNETEFLFKEYSNSFNNSFGILPVPVVPEVPVEDSGIIPIMEEEPREDSEPKLLVPNPKSELNNKLYRKLSLLTHPDKKGGSAEIFNRVYVEYSKGNTLGLLVLALEYHLDILDYFKEYPESDFENDLKILSDSSARIKSSLAWVWQSADSVKRQELQKRFGF